MNLDPGFVGVIVGGLITAIVTIGGQWLRGHQDADLDGSKRRDDRALALDEFQRKTLLELQETLNDLGRLTSELHLADLIASRSGISWGSQPTDSVLNAQDEAVRLRVLTLRTRVEDDEIRQLVGEILDATIQAAGSKSEGESVEAVDAVTTRALLVLDRSGELIRQTFVRA